MLGAGLKAGRSGTSAVGCNNLAISYLNGTGIDRNERKAKELLNKACAGGVEEACERLRSL